MKYLFLSLMFFMNAALPSAHAAKDSPLVHASIQPATLEALKARRSLLRSWAPKCSDGSLTMNDCPFWDAVEYMGMLCLSGETEYCKQVKDSQDETGRWWRSPGYRFHPNPNEKSPTFSHDMNHGAWAYIVATQDKEAALKYMAYIKSIDYHMCPKSQEGWDACATRLTFWTFTQNVYEWLHLPLDQKKMKGYKFPLEAIYSPIEARTQPKNFPMILTAEGIYTIQKMEEQGAKIHNRKMYDNIAKIIHNRVPENPFYEYLVYGANESSAQKLLKICPSDRPVVPVVNGNSVFTEPANGPWEQGSGHYCIFMINAILGSAN